MDIADEAARRESHFNRLAMQNRYFDLPPAPPLKTDASGNPLCIECDINIAARRDAVANAQRCIDCQNDHEKRKKNG